MVAKPDPTEKSTFDPTTDSAAQTAMTIADSEKAAVASSGIPVNEASAPVDLTRVDSKPLKGSDGGSEDVDVFAHLPEHEAAVLRRQLDTPTTKVNYFTLYRFASRKDLTLVFLGGLAAIIGGALFPIMTIVFGNLAGTFQNYFQGLISGDEFRSQLSGFTLYFVYLGIASFVMFFTSTSSFVYSGEHIAGKVRQQYLAAVLRQNIGYFDKLGAGEITTRITSDTNLIQDGISEKVPLTLQALATFFSAFIVAFVRYWKLTLILCSTIVAIGLTTSLAGIFIMKWNKNTIEQYGKGGSLAEEVLSSIRNATAFNAQEKLSKQYDKFLANAEKSGFRTKGFTGGLIGVLFCMIYLNYALSFWMGSRFLVGGEMSLSQVVTIQLVIIIGAFSLGNVAPSAQAMTTAVSAANKIFATIDRPSPLDPDAETGEKLESVKGVIDLKNIKHIYPSRPEVVVMEDVSLHVPAGKSTALVGASGSGKSTIVGLVERFYDPVSGQVLLDGHDISALNLRWLRQQISLVQQEPVLFATTIFNNIAHGLIGTPHEDESHEEVKKLVEAAALTANAHEFITRLPEGYETNVGDRGFLLSGGQKQRVAIARAIVSDPKILLLDEATSALDTKSEGVVQAALDKAARGRTTIVIAHRLSTIKNADKIVVMSQGSIVEEGRHQELLAKRGAYFELVEAQRIGAQQEAEATANIEDSEDTDENPNPLMPQLSRRSTGRPDTLRLTRTKTSAMSISSKVLKDKKPEGKREYSLWTLIKLIASFNRKEWYLMLTGALFSIVTGGAEPTAAVFFSKSISALSLPPSEYGELRRQANFWCWMYLMLALVLLIAHATAGISFAYASERLIHRARDSAFRNMLRQDMAYFDQDQNSAGSLASFLSTETTKLAGISGVTLGNILTTFVTLFASSVIALAIGWKLALVCISLVPLLIGVGYLRFYLLARFAARSKESYEKSAAYACEAASAIRTVASLTRERDVWEHYSEQVHAQEKAGFHSVLRSSALFAAAQSMTLFCVAIGFWYGGTLIGRGEYTMFQFFLVFTAVIFGAQSAGTIFAFAPDMGKAKSAAASMKALLDRTPAIDSWSEAGKPIEEMTGHIEFRDVHFRYPTRPKTAVLRGLNLTVKPGQYVALVGASGCGKSTTIALLERFYDPLTGQVLIDGLDVTSVKLTDYRSRIALVSQEPTLYQGTIRENILLGAPDESAVSDADVERACRQANIHDFITSLPNGFQTIVGSKGSMLSGGQKQRIAIARALLRDPTVLLLDEATSALDSESEKVVQEALDKAAKGRTTIAVAHRLSTIQRADVIYVIDQGRVAEQGTHAELMRRKGRYCELVNLQNLG